MKILIIDNGSRYLLQLIEFAKDAGYNQVDVVKHDRLSSYPVSGCGLIILSGSPINPVALHPDEYKDEIELVKNTDKPVLGICMGFEIIAYAFGSELERMEQKESGLLKIHQLANSNILNDVDNIEVTEHHRWHIKQLGPDLIPIAESKDGIEIIKVSNKPIYGFQFHPELDGKLGSELLHNICLHEDKSFAISE